MKQFIDLHSEHGLSLKIDPDLVEANNIIMITKVDDSKKASLANSMAIQFTDLDQRYPLIKKEEQLFLLTLALNLMLYAFQTRETDKELQLKHKISSYCSHVFEALDSELTALQKAKWNAVIAKVYGMTHFRPVADMYYKRAIDFTKSAMKTNKNKSLCQALLLDFTIELAKIYVENAKRYETEEIAPDLAYQAHKQALVATKTALQLIPDQGLAVQLHLMKLQALDKLASANVQRKQPKEALKYWIQVLEASVEGLKFTQFNEARKDFLRFMQTSNQGLLALVSRLKEKENAEVVISAIKKINQWLENSELDKLNEVQQWGRSISQALFPVAKPVSFWQKPISEKQALSDSSNIPLASETSNMLS